MRKTAHELRASEPGARRVNRCRRLDSRIPLAMLFVRTDATPRNRSSLTTLDRLQRWIGGSHTTNGRDFFIELHQEECSSTALVKQVECMGCDMNSQSAAGLLANFSRQVIENARPTSVAMLRVK